HLRDAILHVVAGQHPIDGYGPECVAARLVRTDDLDDVPPSGAWTWALVRTHLGMAALVLGLVEARAVAVGHTPAPRYRAARKDRIPHLVLRHLADASLRWGTGPFGRSSGDDTFVRDSTGAGSLRFVRTMARFVVHGGDAGGGRASAAESRASV